MIKWWRGVLALLPTPTKEHFCQTPWVGEALSLCHEARYCINLARLQSLTEHVIGNIQIFFLNLCLPNTVLLWWHFKKMSSICLHQDIFLTQIWKRSSLLQFYLVKVGFIPSVSEMRETPRPEHTDSKSPKVSKAQQFGQRLKFSKILHEGQQTLLAAQHPALRGSESNKNPPEN